MLLSIVIPMYNAEKYISSCLESILNQGLDPEIYEIIVINDGSKDKSVEIVKQYQEKHLNIKLYSQNNRGLSASRNVGMSKAEGQFIQFVDSDDFLVRDSLSQIVKFVQQDKSGKSFDMITFGIMEGDPDRTEIINNGTGECLFLGNGNNYISNYNYNNGVWYYWLNRCFSELLQLKFIEGKLCEDGMFTLTALLNANLVVHLNSTVYFYAIRPNSITTTMNSERRRNLIEGFCYAIDYFENIIKQYDEMNPSSRERIMERRDSYVFFLLVRLLKTGDCKLAKQVTLDLKEKGIYPIKNFPGRDYPGMKYKVITRIFNLNALYFLLCKIYGFKLRDEK